jgi:hypothetical protein
VACGQAAPAWFLYSEGKHGEAVKAMSCLQWNYPLIPDACCARSAGRGQYGIDHHDFILV